MADTHTPPTSEHGAADHGHEPHFKAYVNVFVFLCIFTAASFGVNLTLGQNHTSAGIILLIAIAKASLVAYIFMHLKQDWGTVYAIMVPVAILGVMMIIILSIDTTVTWWHPAEK